MIELRMQASDLTARLENAEAILDALNSRQADVIVGHDGVMVVRSKESYDGEVRFRAMADAAPVMIGVAGPDKRCTWVNQQWITFTGRSLEQECGHGWTESMHADDRPDCLAAISEAFDRRDPFEWEYRVRHADGKYRWLLMHGVPHFSPDGTFLGYIGSCVDNTTRKLAEEQLAEARDAAEQANQAKSRFLAAASHDLRQPLSALALYVGVLKSQSSPVNAKLVASIGNCVDSMSELLTDLLDVSKLDADVVLPKRSAFAIDEMLAGLISVHAAEAQLKGLTLRSRPTHAIAFTDQTLLRRILGNLVANAIRYTDAGGVLIACRRQQGRLWVEVWDTGIGVAADKREIIFEEFTQLGDDARNRGSGLGLAIVAKTARLLDIKIRLHSRLGRGTLFAIEIPTGRAVSAMDHLHFRPLSHTLRIGLVDDNAEVLQSLIAALENEGHEVIAANTGRRLLDNLGNRRPDIVISDYRLAAFETGFDVIKAARKMFGEDLPALLITGDTDPALIRSMADRGIAVHYKPLQIEALQAFLTDATERRSALRTSPAKQRN